MMAAIQISNSVSFSFINATFLGNCLEQLPRATAKNISLSITPSEPLGVTPQITFQHFEPITKFEGAD